METVVSTRSDVDALMSVKSRVSWGALLAGAAVGIAIYSLLAILGIAVGLTVGDDTTRDALSTGAAIWAFVSMLVAMFFAGWVATVCTVGENRREAVLYGVIVWAVTSSLLLWSTAAGLSLGYSAVLSRTQRQDTAMAARTLEADTGIAVGGNANATDGADGSASAREDGERDSEENRAVDRDTRDRLQAASWWTFGGTVISMLAAIGGALLGPYEIVPRRVYVRRDYTAGGVTTP
jgi:MFS family permease